MRLPLAVLAAVLLAGALPSRPTAAAAQAQRPDSLRRAYLLPVPPALRALTRTRVLPAISAGSPTAFGPQAGDAFVGAGLQHRTRFTDRVDGAMVAGFGLGRARTVGLEVALTNFSTFRSGFFRRTGASLKLHRELSGSSGVALGWENAVLLGPNDAGRSAFAVVSRVWRPPLPAPLGALSTTLGVGNGRFRRERDVFAGRRTLGVFGSVGAQIAEPLSLVADWTGQDLMLAASLVPLRRVPLVVTAGVADVAGTAGDGSRLTLGVGMAVRAGREP